ncbi:MAG: peptide-methionine (S)-S-oxide reductase MsrA [Polyangiaceae bacterium]|jgi:peptide-methionine (S)-S-oxide reductase
MKAHKSVSLLMTCLIGVACHAAGSKAEAVAAEPPAANASTGAPKGNAVPAVPAKVGTDPGHVGYGTPLVPREHDQLAAFAAGCFWGVEDAFRHVPGVVATAVGFTGGHTSDPTYEKVCSHSTGHAETVLVEFDPARVPYEHLLRVFFKIHDPTEVNRQGPDIGDQYRSAIFTFSDDEAAAARAAKQAEEKVSGTRIATEIRPIGPFFKAEGYHQQYAERTGSHACPIGGQLETL